VALSSQAEAPYRISRSPSPSPAQQKMHAQIYGKRTWYNLFVEPFLLAYLCRLNYVVMSSIIATMHSAGTLRIRGLWQAVNSATGDPYTAAQTNNSFRDLAESNTNANPPSRKVAKSGRSIYRATDASRLLSCRCQLTSLMLTWMRSL